MMHDDSNGFELFEAGFCIWCGDCVTNQNSIDHQFPDGNRRFCIDCGISLNEVKKLIDKTFALQEDEK